MAGDPLVLTRASQLNAARLGRRRFGAGTTRRESRRLPSRVPGEPETRGALDLDGQAQARPLTGVSSGSGPLVTAVLWSSSCLAGSG